MQSTVDQARDEAGGINLMKKDIEEQLRSLEGRLDDMEVSHSIATRLVQLNDSL